MFMNFGLFAYLSPETYLPVTSVIATVVGIVMMFGKSTLRIAWHIVRRPFQAKAAAHPSAMHGPHRIESLRRSRESEAVVTAKGEENDADS